MSRFAKLFSFLSAGGLIWLIICSVAFGGQQSSPSNHQVTVSWTATTDPTAIGYYVYYGNAPGVYTNKINVNTNTSFTLTGLTSGSTYYFSATSYNGASMESTFVPEVSFVVPGVLTITQNPTTAATRIKFPVASSHTYQLQGSSDMKSWTNIWLTPAQTANGWVEYDEPRNSTISGKFYRLILY